MGEVASGRGYSNGWFTRGTKGSPSGFVSNTHYERGQPSRGIWLGDNSDDDNSCYMDLMWTGMGEGSEDGWRNKPFAEKLQENNSGIYGNARNFIERFCTPGTKFRFRKDPDEVVYTIGDFDEPNCGWQRSGSSRTNSIWNSNHGGANYRVGCWGIRNYKTVDSIREQHSSENKRQRWTVKVTPRIGDNGSLHEYNPVTGTVKDAPTSVRALHHDTTDADVIEILDPYVDITGGLSLIHI